MRIPYLCYFGLGETLVQMQVPSYLRHFLESIRQL